MNSGRHLTWLLAALAFGAVVLPLVVYFTGSAILGPYARGGPGRFLLDFLVDLGRLRKAAWALLAGPAILVLVWRIFVAYAWPGDTD